MINSEKTIFSRTFFSIVALFVFAIAITSTGTVFAADNAGLLGPICRAYGLLKTFSIPIILIVFSSTGIGMFFGKINWQVAMVITAGISLILSGEDIVQKITGTKNKVCEEIIQEQAADSSQSAAPSST